MRSAESLRDFIDQRAADSLEFTRDTFLNGEYDYLAKEQGFDPDTIIDRNWFDSNTYFRRPDTDLVLHWQDEYEEHFEKSLFSEEELEWIRKNYIPFHENEDCITLIIYHPVYVSFTFNNEVKT